MATVRMLVALLTIVLAGPCRAATFTIYTTDFPRLAEVHAGTPAGMYVELMRIVGEATGHRFQWSHQPWPRAQRSAQDDPVGLIINLTRTSTRETLYRWVGVVGWGRYGIFYLRDAGSGRCGSPGSSDQVIGFLNGSDVLDVLQAEGYSRLEGAVTGVANARKLQMGRTAGWAVNVWTGPTVYEQSGFEASGLCVRPLGRPWDQWLAASPNFPADVAAQIGASLRALKADGTFKRLEERFWRPVPGISPP